MKGRKQKKQQCIAVQFCHSHSPFLPFPHSPLLSSPFPPSLFSVPLRLCGSNTFRLKIEELFGIDLRTLALMRIATAMLVLVDLIWRAQYLRAFYTDEGLLPRAPLIEKLSNSWYISLHFMSGRVEVQALLFALSGIFALMMLVGYRTRLATFLSWLFLISLNTRNPLIIHGGDAILALLVFWGMFIPWGALYSVDSALNMESRRLPVSLLSVGTVALLLQMPLIYLFTALLKESPEWRTEFTAVYYVLRFESHARSLGLWIATWPLPILKFMSAATMFLEVFGPVLLFSPFFTRIIRPLALLAFLALQIAFGVSLNLGLFPWISMVALLPFVPTWLWEKLFARLRTPERMGMRIYFDGNCHFCKKTVLLLKTFFLLPETPVIPAQDSPDILAAMEQHNSWIVVDHKGKWHTKFDAFIYVVGQSPLLWPFVPFLRWGPVRQLGTRMYEQVANNRTFWSQMTAPLSYRPARLRQPLIVSLLCAFFLVYVVIDNFGSIKAPLHVPSKLKGLGHMLRIQQHWRMFAPHPPRSYFWYVAVGKLRNNSEVDLFTNGGPVTWQKPPLVSASFHNYRWRTYWNQISGGGTKDFRPYLARYLCREWNRTHRDGELLEELTIYKIEEIPHLDGSKDTLPKHLLWQQRCLEQTKPTNQSGISDEPHIP